MFSCTPRPRRYVVAAAFTTLAAVSLLSHRPAVAAPPLFAEYTVTDLGVLPGGDTSSGRALTYGATVVGKANEASGRFQAFAWISGTRYALGTLPGYTESQADGVINYRGGPLVVGWAYTPTSEGVFPSRAFVNVLGWMFDLGSLGGVNSKAHGVAGQGFIVGESEIAVGSPVTHAFRTAPLSLINPATDDLGTLPGTTNSYGLAVNNRAQVTGQSGGQAYRTKPFSKIAPGDGLGWLDGGTFSYGTSINDLGEVVGESTIAALSPVTGRPLARPFLYDATGLHNLGTLPGYEGGAAAGINNKTQVVGFCGNFYGSNLGGPDVRAFIWTKAKGMRDLNSLIPSLSGWRLEIAQAINEQGQITGAGVIGGQRHGFLLTPKKVKILPIIIPPIDTELD
jgi:probable HAF family extracellular repeat protein